MDRVGIKLWAKEKTRSNKWNIWKGFLAIFAASLGLSFIALLLFSVMIDIGGSSYYDTFTFMDLAVTVGVFALYFLVIGFSVNIYRYIKKIVQEDIADLNELRAPIGQYFKQGFGVLAVGLICVLGTLAFVVPGIILGLGLSMTPYLLANYPSLSIFEAITTSWKMMQGKKMKCFVLFFSFYGWILLSTVTLGILFIWLLPYMTLTFNKFFLENENEFYGVVNSNNNVSSNDIEEFALLSNWKLDTRNNVYGMFNDYPVVVMFGSANNDLIITIDTIGEDRTALDEYFNNLRTILTNIKTINYSNGTITLSALRSEELHEVYEILNRITLKLRDLGFLPSCGTCHINKPTSFYEYHGQLMNMCDDCRDAISTQAEEIVEDSSRGIIGAVAGALIGGVLWALVYQIGFIVAFLGYLIVFLAINGYQRMAGKISKKGLIISIICSVLVLFFAESISLGLKIKDLMQLQSIFTAFSYIPYFLSFSEIFAIVVRDIVLGLIFMGLGSWQYIYKIKKSLDEENLNKLD